MPHIKARTHKQTNKQEVLDIPWDDDQRKLMSNPKKLMIQLQKTTSDIWVGCFVLFSFVGFNK